MFRPLLAHHEGAHVCIKQLLIDTFVLYTFYLICLLDNGLIHLCAL